MAGPDGLRFELIGEIVLKGFSEPTELFIASRGLARATVDRRAVPRARSCAPVACSRGERPVVAMLSGGRDSVCLLDVAVALCGPEQVRALHVNYGLREEADEDERHCERAVRAPGGARSRSFGRRARERATCRRGRARFATRRQLGLAEAARCAGRGRATPPPTRSRRSSTAWPPPRGGGRCWGWPPARGGWSGRCWGSRASRPPPTAVARGLALARGREQRERAYARGRVRQGCVPALRAVHPAAEANVLRTAELLREETELLDGLVRCRAAPGGERAIALERLAQLPAGARAAGRDPPGRAGRRRAYVPQAGERVAEILALGAPRGAARAARRRARRAP